jgi:hypothetical protein
VQQRPPQRGSLSARDAQEHARQQGQAADPAIRPAAPSISERLKWWEKQRMQQQYNVQPHAFNAPAAGRGAGNFRRAERRSGSGSGGCGRCRRSSGPDSGNTNAQQAASGLKLDGRSVLPALHAKDSGSAASATTVARRQPGRQAVERAAAAVPGATGQATLPQQQQQQLVVASMAVMQSNEVAVSGMAWSGWPGSSSGAQDSFLPNKPGLAGKASSSAAATAANHPPAASGVSGLVAAAAAARAAAIAATSQQQQQHGNATSSPVLHGPPTPAAAAPMCRSSSSMFGPILPSIRTHQDALRHPAAAAAPNGLTPNSAAAAGAAAGSPGPGRASPHCSMGNSTPSDAAGSAGSLPWFYTVKEPPGYAYRPDLARPPLRTSLSTGGMIRWSSGGGRTPRSRQGSQAGGSGSSGGARHSSDGARGSGKGARGSSGGVRNGHVGAHSRHSSGHHYHSGMRGSNGRGSRGGTPGSQGGWRKQSVGGCSGDVVGVAAAAASGALQLGAAGRLCK